MRDWQRILWSIPASQLAKKIIEELKLEQTPKAILLSQIRLAKNKFPENAADSLASWISANFQDSDDTEECKDQLNLLCLIHILDQEKILQNTIEDFPSMKLYACSFYCEVENQFKKSFPQPQPEDFLQQTLQLSATAVAIVADAVECATSSLLRQAGFWSVPAIHPQNTDTKPNNHTTLASPDENARTVLSASVSSK